jgi:penicillin-binding protein 2
MMFIKNPLAGVRMRVRILTLLVLAGMGVLIWKLYHIQVVSGDEYANKILSQSSTSVLLPPARGVIVDRNGVGLAENKASIDIDLYLNVLVGNYLRSKKGKRSLTMVPGSSSRKMTDVAKIVDDTTRDTVKSLGFDMDNITRRDILRHYDQKPNVPLRIARNLDFTTLSRIAEHNVNVPGLEETARPARSYNYGAFAAHILGNVGKVEDVPTDASYVSDVIGKDGIEKSMDAYLQGVPGAKILRKNSVGYILGVDAIKEPLSGGTVYLSIDARIQMIVEQEMRGIGRGACVVMDPSSGDILAMVSVPNFDPNTYSGDLGRMVNDATHPLVNRAISGYAVGSEFKLVTAMAAMKNPDAKFGPNTTIYSPAAVYLAGRWWKDWTNNPGEGNITLKTALQWSTNTFFYQLGVRTGIKSIQDMAALCGMGQKLLVDGDGNPLIGGERAGVIPGPYLFKEDYEKKLAAWQAKKKADPKFKDPRPYADRWSDGHTANTSIGQGRVEVTPLQLATMMSAIANGGTVYYPRLVLHISDIPGNADGDEKEFPVRKLADLGVTSGQLDVVRQGLRAVVAEGTGSRAGIPDFQVAGKTGTAQFWTIRGGVKLDDYKTWFNGYAPYANPRYVVTILVEGGRSGGGTCGPIARRIFKRLAELEKGASLDMPYLSPAVGNFLGVKAEMVDASSADDTPASASETPAAAPEFSQPSLPADNNNRSKPTDMQRRMRGR